LKGREEVDVTLDRVPLALSDFAENEEEVLASLDDFVEDDETVFSVECFFLG